MADNPKKIEQLLSVTVHEKMKEKIPKMEPSATSFLPLKDLKVSRDYKSALNSDILFLIQTSYLSIQDIESVEQLARHFRSCLKKERNWKALIERDFKCFFKKHPHLELLKHDPRLSPKERYRKIFLYLLEIQSQENDDLCFIINEPIHQKVFHRTSQTVLLKQIVEETCYLEIVSLYKTIMQQKLLKKEAFGDMINYFLVTEKMIDKINIMIIHGVIEKDKRVWRTTKTINLNSLLTRFPEETFKLFSTMMGLEEINLENCNLFYMPEVIFQMISLKRLNLSHNNIVEISSKIENLHQLEMLNLSSNYLRSVPDALFNLSHLTFLSLGNYRYTDYIYSDGSPIGEKVKGNVIPYLPSAIKKLQKLETLLICSMNLNELPVELGNINSLESIYCANNNIRDIPDEILTIKNLRQDAIHIYGNPMMMKLMLLQYRGQLHNKINVSEQVGTHLLCCTMPGKAIIWAGSRCLRTAHNCTSLHDKIMKPENIPVITAAIVALTGTALAFS